MSIRVKAALVIMAIIIVFTAAFFVSGLAFTRQSMHEATEQQLTFALDIADSLITTKMNLLKSNAVTVAERLVKADSVEQMTQLMALQSCEFPDFISLTVYDRAGIIANYGAPVSHDVFLTENKYILPAFEEGESIISTTHYNNISGIFIMHVFVPMGREYVLSATIPGMFFADIVSDLILLESGNVFMLDEEGKFVAHYRPNLVLEQRNFIEDAKTNPDLKSAGEFYKKILSNERGSGSYIFDGKERFSVYKQITASRMGWYIAVAAPLDEGPYHNVQSGLLLSSLLFLAAGAVIAVFVSGFAARPFHHLKKQNETIQAQAAKIKKDSEQATLMLHATPLACHLWNRKLELCDCNEENIRLFKVKNKEEFLSSFLDFSPKYQPDGQLSAEAATQYKMKAFEEGRCVFEYMHQTFDGVPLPTEVTLVRVAYGDDYAVAGYVRDLREHKKMMEEIQASSVQLEAAMKDAQRANDAKSTFLANMSHEMRTPLNAVIGLSGLSLEADRLNEEDRSNLEKVYNAGSTLLAMVNDILDISKIEAGKLEFAETEYDVPSLINDTVTQNAIRIAEKPVELKLDIGENMFARLKGDEVRVKQIMNNLLSNALKYTDKGTVELGMHCSMEGNTVWLTIIVRDTGRGIRKEDIGKLFIDYAQVDLESNRMIEGTGLGLSITKRLAEMMGGSIAMESEYRKGSVFTVKIAQKFLSDVRIGPEIVKNLQSFRYSNGKRERNARLKRIRLPYARVLIVDDNLTNLDVAKGLMKPYGMQIDCLTDGQQAVNAILASKVRYNAIFMDHMMPGMDGIEATRLIRQIDTDYAKNIPIIALTANAIVGNEEIFLSKGFQAFLAKPIDLPRLDEVIRHFVRDKEQEKLFAHMQPFVDDLLSPDLRNRQDTQILPDRRSGIDRRQSHTLPAVWLDISKGIERFGGDRDTYLQILRSYATNTRPLLESITHISEDTLADYCITVHGIKGSSRGIFAEMLSNSAAVLEFAAKTGDFNYVSKHNPLFLADAWKLIHELEAMLSALEAESPKEKKATPDRRVLAKLLAACKAYDIDGVDEAMADLESYQYSFDDGLAYWLRDKVKLAAFKEITERLTVYLGGDENE